MTSTTDVFYSIAQEASFHLLHQALVSSSMINTLPIH